MIFRKKMKIIIFNPWINSNKKILKNFNKKKDFFLGDWCLKNFDAFENKEFRVLFGADKNLKDINKVKKFVFSYSIYNKILNNLCKSLNIFHKKKEKVKYWEFIISTWLWIFIDAFQKRWNMVLEIKKRNFKKIITLETKNISLATASSEHIKIVSLNSILWNTKLFNEILKFQDFKKLKKIKIKKNFENSYVNKKNIKLKYLNFNKLNKLNTEFFFYNLAIPKKLRINFLLKNLQIPLFSKTEEKNVSLPNEKKIREKWKKTYKFKNSSDKFLNFLNAMIPHVFPRVYLDKFVEVQNISKNLNWPKKPKIILSSYGHFADEIFKIYASNLISNGTKYFIFQHGAAGMYKEHVGQFFEEKLSYKYLTWGWKNNNKNIPMFVNTKLHQSAKFENKKVKNKILFSIYHFPIFPQRSAFGYSCRFGINTYYTNYLIKFLRGLNKNSIKKIFVKNYKLYEPCVQENVIKKEFKNIKFINTNKFSYQINHKFDLTIETYMSTGFFESMMLNRPVILLFEKKLINVDESFTKWIKKLKLSKICFDNLNEANNFLNHEFRNLNKWWNTKNLQRVRLEFCNNFARSPEKFSDNLYKFVK